MSEQELYVANKGGKINGWGIVPSMVHFVFGPKDWKSHGDQNSVCGTRPRQHWVNPVLMKEFYPSEMTLCPKCNHKMEWLDMESNVRWAIGDARFESPGDEMTYEEGRSCWREIMGRRPMPKWLKEGVD